MQPALKIKTTVLPGNRIELSSPELPEGAEVEVVVELPQNDDGTGSLRQHKGVLDFLESLPPGPRLFKTWEEYERFLREERGAWER